MQTEQVRKRYETDGTHNESFEAIGFSLFKLKQSLRHSKSLVAQQLTSSGDTKWDTTIHGIRDKYSPKLLEPKFICYKYSYQREFVRRFDLEPGSYVIIPSAYVKDTQMRFFLRIFCQSEVLKNENLVQLMHSAQIINEICFNYRHARARQQQAQQVAAAAGKREYPYAVKSSSKNSGIVVSGRQIASKVDSLYADDHVQTVMSSRNTENFRFNYLRGGTGVSKLSRSLSTNYVSRDQMSKINQKDAEIDYSLMDVNPNQTFSNRYLDSKNQSKACLVM